MSVASPARNSSALDRIMHSGSGKFDDSPTPSFRRSPSKPRKLQSAHFDEITGKWRCRNCDWAYPNPHPHAHQRREHKKHCEGTRKVERWLGDVRIRDDNDPTTEQEIEKLDDTSAVGDRPDTHQKPITAAEDAHVKNDSDNVVERTPDSHAEAETSLLGSKDTIQVPQVLGSESEAQKTKSSEGILDESKIQALQDVNTEGHGERMSEQLGIAPAGDKYEESGPSRLAVDDEAKDNIDVGREGFEQREPGLQSVHDDVRTENAESLLESEESELTLIADDTAQKDKVEQGSGSTLAVGDAKMEKSEVGDDGELSLKAAEKEVEKKAQIAGKIDSVDPTLTGDVARKGITRNERTDLDGTGHVKHSDPNAIARASTEDESGGELQSSETAGGDKASPNATVDDGQSDPPEILTFTLTSEREASQTNKVPVKLTLAESNWEDWEDVILWGAMLVDGLRTSSLKQTSVAESSSGEYQTSQVHTVEREGSHLIGLIQGTITGAVLESESVIQGAVEPRTELEPPVLTVHFLGGDNADKLPAARASPAVENTPSNITTDAITALTVPSPEVEFPETNLLDQEQGENVLSILSAAERNWEDWEDVVREREQVSGPQKRDSVLKPAGELETGLASPPSVDEDMIAGDSPVAQLFYRANFVKSPKDPRKEVEYFNNEKQLEASLYPPITVLEAKVPNKGLSEEQGEVEGSPHRNKIPVISQHDPGQPIIANTSWAPKTWADSEDDATRQDTSLGGRFSSPPWEKTLDGGLVSQQEFPRKIHDHHVHHRHEERPSIAGSLKYDVVRVLSKQTKYELFCPICGSLITRRMILRKKKRLFLPEGDARLRKTSEITPAVDDDDNQASLSDASSEIEHVKPIKGLSTCLHYFLSA